ncbi:hypothetical protein HPP92_012770 [Vanilla planifolia]|uniref:VQ domain-containing protein n=1 Tax=Vanilla planifolia TaxID=51239 RepID=A0A835QVT5_VANPL|nr:hypothetical protein HPP92_012770 [Vanilla planifolia]
MESYDWMQLSGRGFPPVPPPFSSSSAAEASLPKGRAKKSSRKRPRASRRPPVTLLNTDAANFRNMVQQFTGLPAVPYSTNHTDMMDAKRVTTINFGNGFDQPDHGSNVEPSFWFAEQQQQSNDNFFQSSMDVSETMLKQVMCKATNDDNLGYDFYA